MFASTDIENKTHDNSHNTFFFIIFSPIMPEVYKICGERKIKKNKKAA
jgi:dipeptide/tripeptide permease